MIKMTLIVSIKYLKTNKKAKKNFHYDNQFPLKINKFAVT
jgi:hypothetical protein